MINPCKRCKKLQVFCYTDSIYLRIVKNRLITKTSRLRSILAKKRNTLQSLQSIVKQDIKSIKILKKNKTATEIKKYAMEKKVAQTTKKWIRLQAANASLTRQLQHLLVRIQNQTVLNHQYQAVGASRAIQIKNLKLASDQLQNTYQQLVQDGKLLQIQLAKLEKDEQNKQNRLHECNCGV